jgi:hypothetical protein
VKGDINYDPLIWENNSASRKDKALALIDALKETLAKAPDDTIFKLRISVKELVKQKQLQFPNKRRHKNEVAMRL